MNLDEVSTLAGRAFRAALRWMELFLLPTVRSESPPTVAYCEEGPKGVGGAYFPLQHHIEVYPPGDGHEMNPGRMFAILTHECVHALQMQTLELNAWYHPAHKDHPYEVQAYAVMYLVLYFGEYVPEWMDDAVTKMVMRPEPPELVQVMAILQHFFSLEIPIELTADLDAELLLTPNVLFDQDTLEEITQIFHQGQLQCYWISTSTFLSSHAQP